jgi:hypothetical protein
MVIVKYVRESVNMDTYNYETLKSCLSRKNGDWVGSHDTIMTVGYILKEECVFSCIEAVFEYFEKPWHFEKEMRDLIIDHELEQIASDMDNLLPSDAISALSWLEVFGYDQKAVDALETALTEREYAYT